MKNPEDINSEHISLRRIESYIRNLHVPPEAKVILTDLLKATVNVGGRLYRIGRKAVEIAIILATKFPAITFTLNIDDLHHPVDRRRATDWPCARSHCRATGNSRRAGNRGLQGYYGS